MAADWRSGFFLERMQDVLALHKSKPFEEIVHEVFDKYVVRMTVEKDNRLRNTWMIKIVGDCNIFGDHADRVAALIGMCDENLKARVIKFDKQTRTFVFLCTP